MLEEQKLLPPLRQQDFNKASQAGIFYFLACLNTTATTNDNTNTTTTNYRFSKLILWDKKQSRSRRLDLGGNPLKILDSKP